MNESGALRAGGPGAGGNAKTGTATPEVRRTSLHPTVNIAARGDRMNWEAASAVYFQTIVGTTRGETSVTLEWCCRENSGNNWT